MTLNEAHDWTKANAGKWFSRGGKRSYKVVRMERKRLSDETVALIHVVNDRGLSGVIPYSNMKGMQLVEPQPK